MEQYFYISSNVILLKPDFEKLLSGYCGVEKRRINNIPVIGCLDEETMGKKVYLIEQIKKVNRKISIVNRLTVLQKYYDDHIPQ